MKKKYIYSSPFKFSDEQLKNIKQTPIAVKHNVSVSYVGQVLKGERLANTETAKSIIADAKKVIEFIENL